MNNIFIPTVRFKVEVKAIIYIYIRIDNPEVFCICDISNFHNCFINLRITPIL